MNDDVVKKLEYWAFKLCGKGEQEDAASDVMSEALKEIIKLRDETERLARERNEARAVVERLTEWQSINHSEQHKLGWSMTEFCEGKRDHLHEMWERPPSLDYGIAHIEAEIKRLRAENARLRARLKKRREPDTHPVEET